MIKLHKLLSVFRPSSAKRQLTCTKSILHDVNAKYQTSPQAELGTKIHNLAEQLLNNTFHIDELEDLNDSDITTDVINMLEKYEKYCDNLVHDWDEDIFEIEREIDLLPLYNFSVDKSGSADCTVLNNAEETLHIVDLKTGMNDVSAYNNHQLYIYGHSLLHDYIQNGYTNIKYVEIHIFQNLYKANTNSFKIPVEKLELWIDLNVRVNLNKIRVTDLSYKVGGHCTYCPNINNCTAIYNEIDSLIDIADSEVIDMQIKSDVLNAEKAIVKSINAYKDDLEEHLLQGNEVKGVKLIKGNKRKYIESKAILEDILLDKGLDKDELYNSKMKTPFQIQQVLKDNQIDLKLSDFIGETEPKVIIALSSSNRKAINI